ncbi:sigma-70 family RNA polymerase sigma factor [Ferrovibrio sp.]|uniref:sigma-70 family RNA polymerase sigma factor n=1 Tax=Ferrovibrio sp. TaxID=1917215 RepID=UPI00311E3B6C
MLFRPRQPHPVEAEIPRLRRFALALARDRAAADDLVQDCLLRALAAWTTRRSEESLRPWLFAILHNLWRSRLRRDLTRPDRFALDAMDDEPAASGGQWEALELRDLDAALALLPDAQRSLLLLVTVEGLSYEEAARVQDIPVGTVMSRLTRARERLRRLMDGQPPTGTAGLAGGRGPHLRRVK